MSTKKMDDAQQKVLRTMAKLEVAAGKADDELAALRGRVAKIDEAFRAGWDSLFDARAPTVEDAFAMWQLSESVFVEEWKRPIKNTKNISLDLTYDELTILQYVVPDGDWGDPLKDIYELGDDEPEEPYNVLKSLHAKVMALKWGAGGMSDDSAYEDDGDWECHGCGTSVYLADGCDEPEHGLCWRCCSDAVTTLRARVKELEGKLRMLRALFADELVGE